MSFITSRISAALDRLTGGTGEGSEDYYKEYHESKTDELPSEEQKGEQGEGEVRRFKDVLEEKTFPDYHSKESSDANMQVVHDISEETKIRQGPPKEKILELYDTLGHDGRKNALRHEKYEQERNLMRDTVKLPPEARDKEKPVIDGLIQRDYQPGAVHAPLDDRPHARTGHFPTHNLDREDVVMHECRTDGPTFEEVMNMSEKEKGMRRFTEKEMEERLGWKGAIYEESRAEALRELQRAEDQANVEQEVDEGREAAATNVGEEALALAGKETKEEGQKLQQNQNEKQVQQAEQKADDTAASSGVPEPEEQKPAPGQGQGQAQG